MSFELAKDHFVSEFGKLHREEPSWLSTLRKGAISEFSKLGLPQVKSSEPWRYTNLAKLTGANFAPSASAVKAPPTNFPNLPGPKLVFVNGKFESSLSALECSGVRIESLGLALKRSPGLVEALLNRSQGVDSLHQLNTALFSDGALIVVEKAKSVSDPIQLIFLTNSEKQHSLVNPRNIVVAEPGSQAKIVEYYAGTGSYLNNSVSTVHLRSGATLEWVRLQCESKQASHLGQSQIFIEKGAHFVSHAVSLGAELSRYDLQIEFTEERGSTQLNGLYLGQGDQHVANRTLIDHAKAHCQSDEVYRGILADKSVGVFDGHVLVREGAQKTDSSQSNKNLLLSDEALINTKPQLEIYADDVKCAHGATSGQLDPYALFYLRSRGLEVSTARSLLTQGFANEVLERIRIEAIQEYLKEEISRWLETIQ